MQEEQVDRIPDPEQLMADQRIFTEIDLFTVKIGHHPISFHPSAQTIITELRINRIEGYNQHVIRLLIEGVAIFFRRYATAQQLRPIITGHQPTGTAIRVTHLMGGKIFLEIVSHRQGVNHLELVGLGADIAPMLAPSEGHAADTKRLQRRQKVIFFPTVKMLPLDRGQCRHLDSRELNNRWFDLYRWLLGTTGDQYQGQTCDQQSTKTHTGTSRYIRGIKLTNSNNYQNISRGSISIWITTCRGNSAAALSTATNRRRNGGRKGDLSRIW